MKKTILTLLIIATSCTIVIAQDASRSKFGVKAGYNWSYITGTQTGFNKNSKSGFMASAFYAPTSKGRGYRSEIVFSRQGYTFDEGGKNTDVLNDYVYLPQLATFGIGKFLQRQLGGQVGFLLNSKLSSEGKDSTITNLMNRVDYGFAGGVEIYPYKGIIVGGRYNLGLGKLYKRYEQAAENPYPLPFNPETTDFKNGLFQFFIGYKF